MCRKIYKVSEVICDKVGKRKVRSVVGENVQYIIFFYWKTCLKEKTNQTTTNPL